MQYTMHRSARARDLNVNYPASVVMMKSGFISKLL
jgi:hypothetical protein